MKAGHLIELLALAALWGASFLFMRIAAPSFGPLPLATLRVGGAALMLLPLLATRGELGALRTHWKAISLVGLAGSALPFVMYGIAALALNAGVMSILNATTPMWGALIAWWWLGERMTARRALGLLLGFSGVAWLAWDSAGVKADAHGVHTATAVAACLAATLGYGFAAVFTRKKLAGVPPMAAAAGSQLGATVCFALPAAVSWPATAPGASAWWSAVALALLCSGVAYALYFRLIAHIGATNTTTVTFLIPPFAVLWGSVFLHEPLTVPMMAACVLVLLGTGLTTGLIGPQLARAWRRRHPQA